MAVSPSRSSRPFALIAGVVLGVGVLGGVGGAVLGGVGAMSEGHADMHHGHDGDHHPLRPVNGPGAPALPGALGPSLDDH